MFDFFHTSRSRSEPVHLYEVSYGIELTSTLQLTDAEEEIVVSGKTYQRVQIKHSEITVSGALDRSSVDLTTPRTNPLVELFRVYPPEGVVNLIIYRGERNDPDAQFLPLWSGRILNVALEGSEAKFTCEPISVSVRRPGLRRTYQYACPHALYGPQCRANKPEFTRAASVVGISGSTVSLAAGWQGDWETGKYIRGLIEWPAPNGTKVIRSILQVSPGEGGSSQLLLGGLPSSLYVGATVSVSLGCAHTLNDCGSVFNNMPNYGGQPWIATNNPLGGANMFY